MRFNYNTTATIKRLGAYSADKATYSSVAGSLRGFLRPIDPSHKTEQLQIIGQAYEFNTDGRTQDVRVNDILTINSIEYRVKGVARYTFAGIDQLICLLQISVTA